MTYKCEVCGELSEEWGKKGTLEDCCPHIRLDSNGKVKTLYFGFIHLKCRVPHWQNEIDYAVKSGWLILNPSGAGYILAPQYQ